MCFGMRGDDDEDPVKILWELVGEEHLEDEACVVLLAALWPGEQSSTGSILEDFPYTLAGLGRTLKIVPCANLLSHGHTLIKVEQ